MRGRSVLSAAALALTVALTAGCGVGYTVINSSAKLDRLAVPMTKAQVIEYIGHPDRVVRDDGRMLVWEYSLTARKQWLYELASCPFSMWIGGCLLYPFTNLWSDQREAPHHVVFIDNELCAWGQPSAILQRRKACAASGGAGLMREPVVSGRGPIDRESIGRYGTMAVMLFEDAPGAPGTGSRVAGMVATLMLDLDVHMVERTQLDDVLQEQVVQLTHGDDSTALTVGRLVGAEAIIVGEIQQWEQRDQEYANSVSLALRMIDVETGLVLFSGQGHLTDRTNGNPESSARLIVNRILTLFGTQTGLLGSGRIGVTWVFQEERGMRFYLVRELRSGLPAEQAGLLVGDRVVACNGQPLSRVKTEREAKRLCQVDVGQDLELDVRRAERRLVLHMSAQQRPGL